MGDPLYSLTVAVSVSAVLAVILSGWTLVTSATPKDEPALVIATILLAVVGVVAIVRSMNGDPLTVGWFTMTAVAFGLLAIGAR